MTNVYIPAFDYRVGIYTDDKYVLKSYPVSIRELNDLRISETHWHDFLQIWYVISGEYKYTSDGKVYTQRAGDTTLFFPFKEHKIDSTASDLAKTKVLQISVRIDALLKNRYPLFPVSCEAAYYNGFLLEPRIKLTGKAKETADHLCLELISEFNKHAAMHTTKMLHYVASLLEICSQNAKKTAGKDEIISKFAKYEAINSSIAFIRENLHKKITLDDISKASAMSRSPFTLNFKSVTGQSCHNYLISERMKKAVYLLKTTRKRIPEIASECGFFDSSHLSRKCREIYGVSPVSMRHEIGCWMREYGDEIFKRQIKSISWVHIFDDEALERHQISLLHN